VAYTLDTGYLKVSFFGPFYGSYIIFELDESYQYALVSGPDKSYLWILARQPNISESLKKQLIDRASQVGFDLNDIQWVQQDIPSKP
jgi:apolipoprotein D and lipocalin family protein